MKKIVLLSVLAIMVSCGPIYKILTGVRNPKIEKISSLKKYLNKQDVPYINCYVFPDSTYMKVIQKNNAYFATYEVYNDKWQKIIPKDTLTNLCYGRIGDIIKQVDNKSLWKIDLSALNTSNFISKGLYTLDKKKFYPININKGKYLVVFYWAKFMGVHAKNILQMNNEIILNKEDSVEVININMDLRENMGEKYLDSINIDLSF